jgi:glyoxylase-like metal-dependent hydrolase (beta-lactamase superfamily II)
MDGLRGGDFGADDQGQELDDVIDTPPPVIGQDERRMQVRAYNYWAGLLGKRRFPLPDRLIEDGDLIDVPGWDVRAIWTPGHSPGHLCLVAPAAGLLLSGDHVLPRISPNISMHSQQFPNPLGDYLASLLKIGALECDEVLPAHEYRFRGLKARTDQLIAHHEERLVEIETLLDGTPGLSAWELTVRLTWSRPFEEIPSFMQRAANGETLAHLVLLEARGRVSRIGDRPARFSRQEP